MIYFFLAKGLLDVIYSTMVKLEPIATFVLAIVTFLLFIATFILALIALFQDRLRTIVFSANLDLEPGPFYPDYNKVPITNTRTGEELTKACCLGIRVRNSGPSSAEKVEVFVAKLCKEENGVFQKVVGFYPLNLMWRNYNTVFLDRILPNTSRECALGQIVNPNQKQKVGADHASLGLPADRSPFQLTLSTIPNTRSDLLKPGKYHLFLEIGAENARHVKKRTVELEFTGEWLPETKKMVVARRL